MDFTRSYFKDGSGVLVRKTSAPLKAANFAKKRILAFEHTTGYAWVKKNWPEAEVLAKTLHGSPVEMVASGSVDAYVNDRATLERLGESDDRVQVLAEYLTQEDWGLAVRKNRPDLLKKLNAALERLERNGELKALANKWLKPKSAEALKMPEKK